MITATLDDTVEQQRQYDNRLTSAREIEAIVPAAKKLVKGTNVIWSPQEGSQTDFMECPMREVLYHGTRGPGKTDGLIMSYAQHVGKGFGQAWRGIIFRQTYPQLADVVAKSERWFRQIFNLAKFSRSKMQWEWPDGEVLMFRHMQREVDYWNYHGHEYPFIGFEELTNWPTPGCFTMMFACSRSSVRGVPRMIRATTNPYGVGHNWVKDRYNLHGKWWETQVIKAKDDPEGWLTRVAIHGNIDENRILLDADPNYKKTIIGAASNPAMAAAWLKGAWDIVAGGMFDDVWKAKHNIVAPFKIPKSWRIDRSFDWGSSAPFSVGWWAESDGTDYIDAEGVSHSTVRGDIYRVYEWYGWTGQPNQGLKMLAVDVAKGIVEREILVFDGRKVHPGPADSAIYAIENGVGTAFDMAKPIRLSKGKIVKGVTWTRADKKPGSRKLGWEATRQMMRAAQPNEDGTPREKPGLFVFDRCDQFIRTVPTGPRSKKDPDDLDTDSEDHIADEVRYRVRFVGSRRPSAGGVGPGKLGPRLIQGSG